jgi:hypothetical protein
LYFLSKFLENGTVLFHYLSTEEPNCESLKILDSVDKTLYLEIKLRNELFVRDRIKDLLLAKLSIYLLLLFLVGLGQIEVDVMRHFNILKGNIK